MLSMLMYLHNKILITDVVGICDKCCLRVVDVDILM